MSTEVIVHIGGKRSRRSNHISLIRDIFPPSVPWRKVFFRPWGLSTFLISIPLGFITFGVSTLLGGVFYAGTCYWAFQRLRNRMFPPGTLKALKLIPYRRRRSAHLALEYAKDVRDQVAALPPGVQSRVPFTENEIGAMAGTVIKLYIYEDHFRRLAEDGTKGARDQANSTAKRAAKILDDIKQLQKGVLGLSLSSHTSDIALMDDAAAIAIKEVAQLRDSIEGARFEIDQYIELEGLEEFAALEAENANDILGETETQAFPKTEGFDAIESGDIEYEESEAPTDNVLDEDNSEIIEPRTRPDVKPDTNGDTLSASNNIPEPKSRPGIDE